MGKKSSPSAPDPYATAAAQGQQNRETAIANANLNRIGQYTPDGSLSYTKDYNEYDKPLVNSYTATLSNTNKQLSDLQNRLNGTQDQGQRGAIQGQINALQGDAQKISDKLNSIIPNYSQVQTLSPDQQRLKDMYTQGQGLLGSTALNMGSQVQDSYRNPIDTSNLPGFAYQANMGNGNSIQEARDAAYNQQTAYLDPRYQQEQSALETKLANQGLDANSEAYKNAVGDFGRQKTFAYQQAQNAAVGAGNEQQGRLFGQAISNANLQNAGNQAALQQQFAIRNQPLNEFNSLLTGAQVSAPQFNPVAQVGLQGTDIAGSINNAYNQKVATQNANTAGITSLIGSGIGAYSALSDRRLKKNIVEVGETKKGFSLYMFHYNTQDDNDHRHLGVMAQDVMETMPEAVHTDENGFMSVDYGMVL